MTGSGPREAVAAIDDVDLPRVLAEQDRALDRGVAAAHGRDDVAAVKGRVARRAEGDAAAGPLLLVLQPELSTLPAHRQDHGGGREDVALGRRGAEQVAVVLDAHHVLGDDRDIVPLHLLPELHHQLEAVDLREAGVVLDVAARGCLAAERLAEDDRPHLVSGGVQSRGEPGCPLPGDQHVVVAVQVCGHGACLPLRRVDVGAPFVTLSQNLYTISSSPLTGED